MRSVLAEVPVRLDLAGGTLDVWPLPWCLSEPPVTVNVALDLPSRAQVAPGPEEGRGIRLGSRDAGRRSVHDGPAALARALAEGREPLALLAHAVLAAWPADEPGLTLLTEATSPQGAGLGGSSALLCAVLAALDAGRGVAPDPSALCARAHAIETRLLRTATGYQDYRPAVHGGCLALTADPLAPGGVAVERIPVDLERLARRLLLAFTGAPHHSGLTNWGVLKAFLDGERRTVEALEAIARNSRAVRAALVRGDLGGALDGVLEDGARRRAMAPGVSTPAIEALDARVRAAGALGTKILGAGGGGSVLVVLAEGGDPAPVRAALAQGPGRELPLALAADGLRLREV